MKLDFVDELGLTEYVLEEACRNNLDLTWEEAQKIGKKLLSDFVNTDCDSRLVAEATYSVFPSKYNA